MNQILLEEGLEYSKVDTEHWLRQPHVQMSLDRAIAWAEANPPQANGFRTTGDTDKHAMTADVKLDLNNLVFQEQRFFYRLWCVGTRKQEKITPN